jgi:hypothetical protein
VRATIPSLAAHYPLLVPHYSLRPLSSPPSSAPPSTCLSLVSPPCPLPRLGSARLALVRASQSNVVTLCRRYCRPVLSRAAPHHPSLLPHRHPRPHSMAALASSRQPQAPVHDLTPPSSSHGAAGEWDLAVPLDHAVCSLSSRPLPVSLSLCAQGPSISSCAGVPGLAAITARVSLPQSVAPTQSIGANLTDPFDVIMSCFQTNSSFPC